MKTTVSSRLYPTAGLNRPNMSMIINPNEFTIEVNRLAPRYTPLNVIEYNISLSPFE